MNKRPDLDLVNKHVNLGIMKSAYAMEWISLPLIDFPKLGTELFNSFDVFLRNRMKAITANETTIGNHPSFYFDKENYFFHDFIIGAGRPNEFARVTLHDDWIEYRVLSDDLKAIKEKTKMIFGHFKFTGNVNGFDVEPIGDTKKTASLVGAHDQDRLFDVYRRVTVDIYKMLSGVINFIEWNNQNDRYIVSVKAEKPYKVKGIGKMSDRLRSKQGPSIIYLNRLPSTGIVSDGNVDGGEKRAHQRRGTWKTLRAERYRNHPKFMVEKGVYVKPAWVGPREAIVEGNIYTILE